MRARASEFPNDNRSLHRGAIWVTDAPCGPWESEAILTPAAPCVEASAAVSAPTLAPAPAPPPVPTLAASEPTLAPASEPTLAPTLEPPPEPTLPPEVLALDEDPADIEIVEELEPLDLELGHRAEDDPFRTFIQTLVEVAVEAGLDRAAAILPALLDEGRVMPGVLPDSVTDALLTNGTLSSTEAGLVGGESFRRTSAAWRAILRGDSEDFSSCGSRMLDEWAADLVACLVLAPAKTEGLRRQLRTRGVAAFGLVLAA
jgi:hypothetical protein